AVSDLERGAKCRPHPSTVRLLAEALELAGSARVAFEAARGRGTATSAATVEAVGSAAPLQGGGGPPPLVGRQGELALLERPLPAWTLPPEQERRLLDKAVGRLLANVAGPAGTLLLLDDLQWADPDALELLATLVRAAAEIPLRVLGAYRDTEVQTNDPLAGV